MPLFGWARSGNVMPDQVMLGRIGFIWSDVLLFGLVMLGLVRLSQVR